jgi:molecular chaperone DnaK (HSP70)
MGNVPGNDPIPSYREEFQHGMDLFERSLQAYSQSNMENQKAKFKEVMAKASHIMSETAPEYLKPEDQQQLAKLQEDFKAFSKNSSSEMMKKLQNDINNLKNIS